MELDRLLHDLQYDVEKTRPSDWHVDWDDKPLAFKLYRDAHKVPLPADVPLRLDGEPGTSGKVNANDGSVAGFGAVTRREERPRHPGPDLRKVGHFLWYSFGLAQVSHCVQTPAEPSPGLLQMNRRFAPSGGALYPNELYAYLNIPDLPAGVYHYDAAHHRLALLREGCFDVYISRALGGRCDIGGCFGVAFVTAMFWKNFYKYNHFSYRLQGMDAGALIGQLLESAKRFDIEAGVYYRFLDRAVNWLLGLPEEEESAYAVIPLSADGGIRWFAGLVDGQETVNAQQLCGELPPIRHDHFVRSRTNKPFPMLLQLNEASMLESLGPAERIFELPAAAGDSYAEELVTLPRAGKLAYDFAVVCRKRHSPHTDFVMGPLEASRLATLLSEAMASFAYRNDLDGLDGSDERRYPRAELYVMLHGVEDVPDGAYRYDSAEHALLRRRPGDLRLWVQYGMAADNVNALQVPLCLHVAGDRRHYREALGYRGYRIQQMEAGMLTQHVLLTAVALGLGGHPLLGFDARLCDELYRMPSEQMTSLIQIPVGWPRPAPRLTGGLHG